MLSHFCFICRQHFIPLIQAILPSRVFIPSYLTCQHHNIPSTLAHLIQSWWQSPYMSHFIWCTLWLYARARWIMILKCCLCEIRPLVSLLWYRLFSAVSPFQLYLAAARDLHILRLIVKLMRGYQLLSLKTDIDNLVAKTWFIGLESAVVGTSSRIWRGLWSDLPKAHVSISREDYCFTYFSSLRPCKGVVCWS
jgi:hypothetical protein